MPAIESLIPGVLLPLLASLAGVGLIDWFLMAVLLGLVLALAVMLWMRPF